MRNRLIGSGLYELPIGRGRLIHSNSNWLNQVIGGWSASGLVEVHSGTALSVYDATNNTGSFSDGVRPNLVGDPNHLPSGRTKQQKLAQWFNTAAVEQNPAYTFGNAPRTFGREPGLFTTDLTAIKSITFHDRHTFEFRAEAFNAFNHANLGNPNSQFGTGTFGSITSLQSGTTGSRVLQPAGHYTFSSTEQKGASPATRAFRLVRRPKMLRSDIANSEVSRRTFLKGAAAISVAEWSQITAAARVTRKRPDLTDPKYIAPTKPRSMVAARRAIRITRLTGSQMTRERKELLDIR